MNLGTMVTVDEGDDVYPGSGPREEVKPYILLDYIAEYEGLQSRSTSRSHELNPK